MNIENVVAALLAKAAEFDANMLLRLTQSNSEIASLHSPVKASVTFIDPRGQETEVSLAFLTSYEVRQYSLDNKHLG